VKKEKAEEGDDAPSSFSWRLPAGENVSREAAKLRVTGTGGAEFLHLFLLYSSLWSFFISIVFLHLSVLSSSL
jgi:hypothetical protein